MNLENVYWQLPIVTYPFISGLVAGSFIVSTLSKVFGQKKFEPVAKIGLLVSFALLAVAPMAPGADLRQPINGYELYTRPHVPYAPISFFTAIWTTYMILMVFEGFFLFRTDLVRLLNSRLVTGIRATVYRLVTFGRTSVTADLETRDHRIGAVLAAVGIPMAFAFHGYVGFIFGALKARPLWSTPLMPVLFITSAIVSGVAAMNLIYMVMAKYFNTERRIDPDLLEGMTMYLLGFMLFDIFLDLIELLTSGVRAYASGGTFSGFSQVYLGGPLTFTYFGLQLLFGLVIPIGLVLFRSVRRSPGAMTLVSLLVLQGVYAMRFNTIISGQLQPKVGQGLIQFHLHWLGDGSVQIVLGLFAVALLIFEVLAWLFPWQWGRSLSPNAGPSYRSLDSGLEVTR